MALTTSKKMAATRPKPYYQVIDGVPRCPFMTPESLRQGLDFVARKGDLLQVSYPRSGTHWVQYITQLILKEGEPVDTYEQFMEGAVFIEYFLGAPDCKQSTPMRTLCTHLPLSKDKLNPEAKYIYVARNPWDVCVSLYHHENNLSVFRFEDGTFDDFLEVFLTGELGYGFYFDHVTAGYALKDEPNVFFVTYEELTRDTRRTVIRLARFIGECFGAMLEEEGEERLSLILQRSSARSMKDIMIFNLSENADPGMQERLDKLNPSSKAAHEGDSKLHEVLRQAKVGGWREYFSPEQLRRMEATIEETTRGSDVMELWSDMRREALSLCEQSG
ncbi:amine sulfotransferase-like [Dermacentor albipictus]|uniref:amine sulfotransferase-like n=1 Tax=Dermacentor albipictus TaxID=60249 RepID=UPI0031FCC27E